MHDLFDGGVRASSFGIVEDEVDFLQFILRAATLVEKCLFVGQITQDVAQEGKLEEAQAERYKSDMAFLARLNRLENQLDAGDVKLGIDGGGMDNRCVLLGVGDPVKARDVMDYAKLFFTSQAHQNSPIGFMPRKR